MTTALQHENRGGKSSEKLIPEGRLRRLALRIRQRTRRWKGRLFSRADRAVRRMASRSPWLSSLYYATLSSAFSREHRAFLMGSRKYDEATMVPQETSALLRRNIHRLEKGILMRPRRGTFGRDYIMSTVQCYERLLAGGCQSDELRWAHDVITTFFSVVESDPVIDDAKKLYQSLKHPSDCTGEKVPYRRDLSSPPSVGYDDLLELARRRRSVRWFLDKPVARELIDKAIEVAKLSPSACNRQPFEFRVLDEREFARRVAAIAMGTAGYCNNIPVLVAVVGRLSCYFSERDRHLIYVDGSLASMALVFAFETLGVATCCINWPDVEELERRISDELQLQPDERVIMLMAVGFPDPDGMVAYSEKKPVDQLRRFN